LTINRESATCLTVPSDLHNSSHVMPRWTKNVLLRKEGRQIPREIAHFVDGRTDGRTDGRSKIIGTERIKRLQTERATARHCGVSGD